MKVTDDISNTLTIDQLLHLPFKQHVGSFEIPYLIKGLLSSDEINAIISWYIEWKLTSPPNTQNTCTINDLFGYDEGAKVIIAINLYKYLRNKGFDPDVVEEFIVNNK